MQPDDIADRLDLRAMRRSGSSIAYDADYKLDQSAAEEIRTLRKRLRQIRALAGVPGTRALIARIARGEG